VKPWPTAPLRAILPHVRDPSPPLTADQFFKLRELGIISGHRQELIDGRIAWGAVRYPLVFHPRAVRAAEEHDIKLLSCVDAVLADERSMRELLSRLDNGEGKFESE
jgi:hypothetical protein